MGRKENLRREVASMTKMMTAYVVNRLAKNEILNYNDIVEVSPHAASINGTTAKLEAGDELCVGDLMYGLMLPSGNDAAYALAQHCTTILGGTGIRLFIEDMNTWARRLGMKDTKYNNPHGLGDI